MSDQKDRIYACLNLMRRLQPSKVTQNLNALANLAPDLEEELLQRIDQPLEVQKDEHTGKYFIKSEFNRDGDSYRSPWSNRYFPDLEDALFPSEEIRQIEVKANYLFDEYRRLYYDDKGVSSTYVWEKEEYGSFALAFLMKKDVNDLKGIDKGIWDSINVVDVKLDPSNKVATYKVTTSVIMEMAVKTPDAGDIILSGSLSKKLEETYNITDNKSLDEFHLSKIGRMIEDIETRMRMSLDTIYLGKTREIVFSTRMADGEKSTMKIQKELIGEIFGKN